MRAYLDATFLFTAGLNPEGSAACFLKDPKCTIELVTSQASFEIAQRNLQARDWSLVRNLHRSLFRVQVVPFMGGSEAEAAMAASASVVLSCDPSRHAQSDIRALGLAELRKETSYETQPNHL